MAPEAPRQLHGKRGSLLTPLTASSPQEEGILPSNRPPTMLTSLLCELGLVTEPLWALFVKKDNCPGLWRVWQGCGDLPSLLCDFGQENQPLWAAVATSVKWK